MSTEPSFARNEKGAMALVVSLLSVALFVVAALVVDLGLARDTKRQAQNAADAAALAAANVLYGDDTTFPRFDLAVEAAKDYARFNFGVTDADWASCTDDKPLRHQWSGSGTSCISFEYSVLSLPSPLDETSPDRVRVLIPTRNVPTGLGRLAGVTEISISAAAEANLRLATPAPCALCVLGDLRPNAHVLQNGTIKTAGGNIHFNGNVSVESNGAIETDQPSRLVTVQGALNRPDAVKIGTLRQGAPKQDDPLASLPVPNWQDVDAKENTVSPCDPISGGPGRYDGHEFTTGTCALKPGLYVIAGDSGASWRQAGSALTTDVEVDDPTTTIDGRFGVTLYFTCGTPVAPKACAPGEAGPGLDASGSAVWRLRAPVSQPNKGLLLMFDRNNTSGLTLKGRSGANLSGTIYAARGTLTFRGRGCATIDSTGYIDSLIVAWSISAAGSNSCLHSQYNISSNVPMPHIHLSR